MNTQPQQPATEQMTSEQWCKTHRNFKTIINGQRYILRWTPHGTGLVPVTIKEQSK